MSLFRRITITGLTKHIHNQLHRQKNKYGSIIPEDISNIKKFFSKYTVIEEDINTFKHNYTYLNYCINPVNSAKSVEKIKTHTKKNINNDFKDNIKGDIKGDIMVKNIIKMLDENKTIDEAIGNMMGFYSDFTINLVKLSMRDYEKIKSFDVDNKSNGNMNPFKNIIIKPAYNDCNIKYLDICKCYYQNASEKNIKCLTKCDITVLFIIFRNVR